MAFSYQHQAAIALGSNLGDPRAILDGALQALQKSPDIDLKTCSNFYNTVAVGPPQPDFLNACAVLETNLSPRSLLHKLLDIEASFGRERREKWGPRTLDLDLLLFDDRIISEPGLSIPHPHMGERAFVLVPLCEIAPHWIHPGIQKAIADLIQTVNCSGVTLAPETDECTRNSNLVR